MDSANSGSLQSSSGGDEEYDSRAAESVLMSSAPQFLEPLPGYLHLHQNPNPLLLNPSNLAWPNNPHSMFLAAPSSFVAENSATASPINNGGAAPRNPKKRSRASRRAPTTVLTTDTTNFRAMVQEFTGIPAPPFNTSSFPRSRLDFFASRSADSAQPPPYLRRPFAQKVHPPHPLFSTSTSLNYNLPNLFNIPNQNQNQNILTSLLQSNQKIPFSTKPQTSFEIIQNDYQFGLSHHNHQLSETLPALPSLIPSATDKAHVYDFQTSQIGGKISENNAAAAAAARGEGMVESWICSSE